MLHWPQLCAISSVVSEVPYQIQVEVKVTSFTVISCNDLELDFKWLIHGFNFISAYKRYTIPTMWGKPFFYLIIFFFVV